MACIDGYAHIYLSPHLDDAVLSCAGRMRRQVQAGERTLAVTLFAGLPDPAASVSPYAQDLHARWGHPVDAVKERRREDREALAIIGVEAAHWGYRDCIYRRTPEGGYAYAGEEALWGGIHASDGELTRELTGRLSEIPLVPDGVLYVPLGVGGHVDHRIARKAAQGCGRTLIYYEDFPYATDPELVENVLTEGLWASELIELSKEELEVKIAAINCYRSQISSFWMDQLDMASSVRAFSEAIGAGAPAERYWRSLESA